MSGWEPVLLRSFAVERKLDANQSRAIMRPPRREAVRFGEHLHHAPSERHHHRFDDLEKRCAFEIAWNEMSGVGAYRQTEARLIGQD